MLKIDKQAHAVYITIRKAGIRRTIELKKGIFLDLDACDNPVGIEIIGINERWNNEAATKLQGIGDEPVLFY